MLVIAYCDVGPGSDWSYFKPKKKGESAGNVGPGTIAKATARRVRTQYEFIKAHRHKHSVQTMCRLLRVAPSGYYAWLAQPVSDRAREDTRLLRLIRASLTASQGIYGPPRVFLDLREAGEGCSKHRVARLMREHQLIDELDRCGQAGTAASVLVPELGPISRPESSSPI